MINENAILVALTISLPPMTRKARGASEDVEQRYNTSRKQAGVVKSLFAKKDLKPLTRAASAARTLFSELSLPFSKSHRIIPTTSYYTFVERMGEVAKRYDNAKTNFLRDYHITQMRSEVSLGRLYSEKDYPTVGELSNIIHFTIEAEVIPAHNAFDELAGLDAEAIEKLKADAIAGQADKIGAALEDLFKRLFKSMDKAAKRLGEEDAVFRDTLIGNIEAAISAAESLNLTNDQKIIDLANEAKDIIEGITAADLRADAKLRKETSDKLANASEFF